VPCAHSIKHNFSAPLKSGLTFFPSNSLVPFMAKRKTRTGGLAAAIAAVGSPSDLADGLGLTLQAVCQWSKVPPERCLDVERVTGVSRHVLRPDIYGPLPVKKRSDDRVAA
jgi:hypothetical protein